MADFDTPKKPWYQSKTFLTGLTIIALSVVEALNEGAAWRELVGITLGLAVVIFRKMAWKQIGK